MENSIFDYVSPVDKNTGNKLLESYSYWQGKRLLFNIIVGVAGSISLVFFSMFKLALFDIFGLIAWGITANILYSVGYMLESFGIVRSGGQKDLKSSRSFLFWVGTLAYALVGFVYCMTVFMIGGGH